MTTGDTRVPVTRAHGLETQGSQVGTKARDSHANDRDVGDLCPACGQSRPPDLPVWVDLPANEIVIEGRRVTVSRHVADTMAALVACRGRVAGHDYLMESVYGLEGGDWPEPNVLSVRMVALRKILKPRGYQVENVWGRGYRLVKLAPEA